jgi:hypothetical protein
MAASHSSNYQRTTVLVSSGRGRAYAFYLLKARKRWRLIEHSVETEVPEVALAILRYLAKQPDAKDTLDGIAQWWLLREWTERKIHVVEQAVTLLITSDLIVETRREGQPPLYALNGRKREEIAQVLDRS